MTDESSPQGAHNRPLPQEQRGRQTIVLFKAAQSRMPVREVEHEGFVYTGEDNSDKRQNWLTLIKASLDRTSIQIVEIRKGKRRGGGFFSYSKIDSGKIVESLINSPAALERINTLFNEFPPEE